MSIFDSDRLLLRNKREHDDIVSFTIWSAANFGPMKIASILNIPESKIDYNHQTSAGYWININIPKEDGDRIIKKIEEAYYGITWEDS